MMEDTEATMAKRIALAAMVYEHRVTGRVPEIVTVVLGDDAVIIKACRSLAQTKAEMVKSSDCAVQLRESQRIPFNIACEPLRCEIGQITGVEVREAVAEVESSIGIGVKVFSPVQAVNAGTRKQIAPELLFQNVALARWADDGGAVGLCYSDCM
jgi:uncharacterized protein YbcI